MARNDQAQLWLPVKVSPTGAKVWAGHTHGTVGDNSVSVALQGHDLIPPGSRNPSNFEISIPVHH